MDLHEKTTGYIIACLKLVIFKHIQWKFCLHEWIFVLQLIMVSGQKAFGNEKIKNSKKNISKMSRMFWGSKI